MKSMKFFVTVSSLLIGCVTLGYADDPRWGAMEDASLKSNVSYDSGDQMDRMEEYDYCDMEMSPLQAGSSDNMEGYSSLNGYGEGVSTNPGGQRGRSLE